MEKGDYEAFVKLNGDFDKAIEALRECHMKEVREMRDLYLSTARRVTELEIEIQKLKGENNG